MITFLNLGRHGRLGNQLFQYAALKSIALKSGYECKIPNPATMHWHGQQCLLGEFNIEAEILTDDDIKTIQHLVSEPSPHFFYEQFFNVPDKSGIHGYFQSTHYFEEFKEQICKELTPKKEYLEFAEEYLAPMREDGAEIVSLHMRRGDMSDGTNPDYINFYGANDSFEEDSIFGRYLAKAMRIYEDKNVKFLIFSGGSRSGDDREDIIWANEFFDDAKFHISNTNDPMKDFSLIRSCDHNITCHLTTFGWWAAYLNPNPEKIVVAPSDYFYDMPTGYTRPGFFPSGWKLV